METPPPAFLELNHADRRPDRHCHKDVNEINVYIIEYTFISGTSCKVRNKYNVPLTYGTLNFGYFCLKTLDYGLQNGCNHKMTDRPAQCRGEGEVMFLVEITELRSNCSPEAANITLDFPMDKIKSKSFTQHSKEPYSCRVRATYTVSDNLKCLELWPLGSDCFNPTDTLKLCVKLRDTVWLLNTKILLSEKCQRLDVITGNERNAVSR
jgi:hypothetical protein